jgi:hypothetical protein
VGSGPFFRGTKSSNMSKGVGRLLRVAARCLAVGIVGFANELGGAWAGCAAAFCVAELEVLEVGVGCTLGAAGRLNVGREASKSSLSVSCDGAGAGAARLIVVVDERL